MTNDFFDFLFEPSVEAFLRSRQYVVTHADYDPYSDDLKVLDKLLEDGKYQEAIDHKPVNVLLSPRAHMLKAFGYRKLGNKKGEESERFMYTGIIKAILSTGDGTIEQPYIVTRVSDEKDVLFYLQEELEMQLLMQKDGRDYDKLRTKSGKAFHFDITDAYARMSGQSMSDARKLAAYQLIARVRAEQAAKAKEEAANRPWWKFW